MVVAGSMSLQCLPSVGSNILFPFRFPLSGPNKSSAAIMSCLATGQPGNRLLLTILMKTRVLGRPIVVCNCLACLARSNSAFVYAVLLSSTVMTRTVAADFGRANLADASR